MNLYGVVCCDIWDKKEFKSLPPFGMVALLYLWTHQKRNNAGIYRESAMTLSALCPLATKDFLEGFQKALEAGFIFEDKENTVILVNRHVKWCPPFNPNIVRSWKLSLREIPASSPLRMTWVRQSWEAIVKMVNTDNKSVAFLDAFQECFGPEIEQLAGSDPDFIPEPKSQEPTTKALVAVDSAPIKLPAKKRKHKLTDEEFYDALHKSPAYAHIDLDGELAKMDNWFLVHPGREKTREFVTRWLNKIQKPLAVNGKPRGKALTPIGEKNFAVVETLQEEHALKFGTEGDPPDADE